MDIKVILVLVLALELCSGANILAVFTFPGFSHFVMFGHLLKELAKRGHNLDVVTHFYSMAPIERYKQINIRGSSPIVTDNMTVESVRSLPGVTFIKHIATASGPEICKNSFETPQLKKLKKSKRKYDIVISELFGSDCMLGWAWHFGVPSVVMTSSANLPWAADRFGLPDNPSYIPHYFMESEGKMTLYERIVNTMTLVQAKLIYWWYSSAESNRLAKGFFGKDMPDLDVLAHNTSLQLINTHFSINSARPLVPNVVEVAGLHIEEPEPVSEDFDELLTTKSRGIIYFTMGSVIKTESMAPDSIQAMFDAFAQLPYKVIWRAKKEDFPRGLKFPENIHFESWFPQLDILCDPRVKLFVSHGGMMGTQEAIYCGVPILGIPLFADQGLNIQHAVSMGFAVRVNYDEITKDNILNAAKKLLNDKKYMVNAKRISDEFRDRPLSALDTAVYWIEYVIRHGGAPRMQSAAKDLAWYQYYLLDVAAIVVGIPLMLVVVLIKLTKSMCSKTNSKSNAKKTKVKAN